MVRQITARQLARMRADVLTVLPGTAILKAPTYAANGSGGGTTTLSPVSGGTVAFRKDPPNTRSAKADIIIVPAKEGLVIDYIATFPHDAPIAADYQVWEGSVAYEIVGLSADHQWNVSRRAFISRVS